MSYSACDFMDDVCNAASQHLGARIPEGEDNADEAADAVVRAMVRAQVERREMLAALRDVQAWNNADIRGIDDITPNLPMLKARRKLIRDAIAKATGKQS